MKAIHPRFCEAYIEQFSTYVTLTHHLSEDTWQKLRSIMRFWRVEKDTCLLNSKETESAIRFLGKGTIKCIDHYKGKSFIYDFRVAPIIVCETVSFINNNPSRFTLETVTECEFIELPREPYLQLMGIHADLACFSATGIVNYLGMTHYRQALLRILDAEERYKLFLREFPSVALDAKQSDIASYLNITQQSLSRLRKNINWKKEESSPHILSNELAIGYQKIP